MSDIDEALKTEPDERKRSPTPIMFNFPTYAPSPSGTHLSSIQDTDPVIATPFQPSVENADGWSASLNLNHIYTSKKPTVRRNMSIDSLDSLGKDKTKKVSSSFSNTMHTLYNDTSVFMYRTNERIHRKLPQLVREKRELRNLKESIDIANSDLRDGLEVIEIMRTIENFSNINELAQSSLKLLEAIKEPRPK